MEDLNDDDLLLIFKGIRPEGMEYDSYKKYRNALKKELKGRLKGYKFHESLKHVKISDDRLLAVPKTYINKDKKKYGKTKKG
jgi:hypothetical protein